MKPSKDFGPWGATNPWSVPTWVFPGYSAQHGPVVQSVTGMGLYTDGDAKRTFSFSARRYADGSVKGEWEGKIRSGDPALRGHGDVTCFQIVGNRAWIGGIIERFPSRPERVGCEAVWLVVDNGQGADAPPDQISRTFSPRTGGASGSATALPTDSCTI